MRNYKMDNLKALLILCVVLGHLLELNKGYGINKLLYIFIYLFHMPAFVYVTGYFASFQGKRLLWKTVRPYLLFQVLYIIYINCLYGSEERIQFARPYWLLWYLFALMVWSLSIPALRKLSGQGRALCLAAALAAAIGAGYIGAMGRDYSLSRILVFYPFFLWGYFERNPANGLSNPAKKYQRLEKWLFAGCSFLIGAVFLYCCMNYKAMHVNWLYEAASYTAVKQSAVWRMLHLGIGSCFIVVFQKGIPDKYLGRLTRIGQNTMSIYLMHGFVIKWMDRYGILLRFNYQTAAAVVLAVILVLFFSAGWFVNLFEMLFSWKIPRGNNKDKQAEQTD